MRQLACTATDILRQLLRYDGRYIFTPLQDIMDRARQLLRWRILAEIARRSRLQHPRAIQPFRVYAQDQYRDPRYMLFDLLDDLQPAPPRHRQIADDKVPMPLQRQLEQRISLPGFHDLSGRELPMQPPDKPLPHDAMIVSY